LCNHDIISYPFHIGGHLNCLNILAIVNIAVSCMWEHRNFYKVLIVFPLGMGIAEVLMAYTYLCFKILSTAHIAILHNGCTKSLYSCPQCTGFPFLHTINTTIFLIIRTWWHCCCFNLYFSCDLVRLRTFLYFC
jgi:hypothetical protein